MFLQRALQPPNYPFAVNGELYVPSHKELWREFFWRLNIFRDRKNWINVTSYSLPLIFEVFAAFYLFKYFSWKGTAIGLFYALVWLPTTCTVYFHRYGTHRAFTFKNRFWIFICSHLMIRIVTDEIYIVSHHLHHQIPDQPGDPYNPKGGRLYCFLADVNHQPIAKDLSETDYARVSSLLAHTNLRRNSYAQYLKWGSVAHPFWSILQIAGNWAFWFTFFYWVGGGPEVPVAIFALSSIWAWGVRDWNYHGHAGGRVKHRDGIDFHRKDLSINDTWTGWVAGEWHNNHHAFPASIRAGFLPHQPDLAYGIIKFFIALGAIKEYRDDSGRFLETVAESTLGGPRLDSTELV